MVLKDGKHVDSHVGCRKLSEDGEAYGRTGTKKMDGRETPRASQGNRWQGGEGMDEKDPPRAQSSVTSNWRLKPVSVHTGGYHDQLYLWGTVRGKCPGRGNISPEKHCRGAMVTFTISHTVKG